MGHYTRSRIQYTLSPQPTNGNGIAIPIPESPVEDFIISIDEARVLAQSLLSLADREEISRQLQIEATTAERLRTALGHIPLEFGDSVDALTKDLDRVLTSSGWSCEPTDLIDELETRLHNEAVDISHDPSTDPDDLPEGQAVVIPTNGLLTEYVTKETLAEIDVVVKGAVTKRDSLVIFPTGWKVVRGDTWMCARDGSGRLRFHADLDETSKWWHRYDVACRGPWDNATVYENDQRIRQHVVYQVDRENYDETDNISAMAEEWLDTNYPDWHNPLAYWD